MSTRVYLAAGVDGVRALVEHGELTAPAFAVSPAMREDAPKADEEDLEYEAALLAEDVQRESGERVVVVAADVTGAGTPAADGSIGVGPVPLSSIVSLHVAEDGADADEELLWYDVTELDDVAAYLGL